jgi:hypothetical protein
MKNKVYSIPLLLAFMVVLSHEMVPHHHHGCGMEIFSIFHNHTGQHPQHDTNPHQHNDFEDHGHKKSADSEKEHRHPFPFHHHLSATNDFDYLRYKLNKNLIVSIPLLTVSNAFKNTKLSEFPTLNYIRFTEIPFFIKSVFLPGAIGLRAPPSLA